MTTLVTHGGARRGAGRPPDAKKLILDAARFARRVQPRIEEGLTAVAEAYPELMSTAIADAKNGDKAMLRYLLDLLPKLIPLRDDEDSQYRKLVDKWQGDLHLHQHVENA